jgi:hypothetical protein
MDRTRAGQFSKQAQKNLQRSGAIASGLLDLIPFVGAGRSAMEGDYGSAAMQGLLDVAPVGKVAGLVAAPMMGIIKPGFSWIGSKVPSVEKLAKNADKFLYHSQTSDKLNDLHYGVEPTAGGSWVREIYSGTGLDQSGDDFFENVTPLAWLSSKPEWVKVQVARKIGKPVKDVTEKDIVEHGHLAIFNKKSEDMKNVYEIGQEGLMQGPYSTVKNIKGKQLKAYETPIYGEGSYGNRLEPFGVERNEFVTTESVEPMLQITGKDLVNFLKIRGLLE